MFAGFAHLQELCYRSDACCRWQMLVGACTADVPRGAALDVQMQGVVVRQ
jgi:hypothetical protein